MCKMKPQLSGECTQCLIEMKTESKAIHEEIKEQSKIHFEKMDEKTENKFNSFEKKVFGLLIYFLSGIGFVILLCAGVVGLTWVQVQNKADKDNVPTITEIQALNQLGDQYNQSVFVKKSVVTADTSAYYFARKNIYGEYSIMRSETTK